MKKLLCSFVAAALISSVISISGNVDAAPSEVLMLRMDERIEKLDTDPVVKNDTPFLPIYMLRDWSGVKLRWDQESKSVTVWSDGGQYVITNGSRTVVNGNKKVILDTPVYITHGRMMIPDSLLEQMTGADVRWAKGHQVVKVNSNGRSPIAIADNRPDVKLYGVDEKDGVYQELILEIGNKRHKYDWKTPLGWKEIPQVTVADLNQDDEPEVVILLNQGSGTGVHSQDVHVVNPVNFEEIPVESLEETVAQWVTSELKVDGNNLHVSVDIKGTDHNITMNIPDHAFTDMTELGFGAVDYHSVKNNKLVLRTGAAIYFGVFIGDLEITYEFRDGRYIAGEVEFIPFEEYKQYVQ
ncbi:copper amine oxidase N-terminal domain-containing protein [Paenibacillus faecalis]|uniref:copper amine oxidase N-terminal domain-containing protein n=1 Tax=Paenibacillus faecalis TaxID=2079532 RepID=UPI000D0EA48A|nr:copper amine oxidase N-terminal domain-containing protein [Paenibacillus faecalis]